MRNTNKQNKTKQQLLTTGNSKK